MNLSVRLEQTVFYAETNQTFLTDLWSLTRPYWFSEERWAAWGPARGCDWTKPRPGLYPRADHFLE
jgi:hypothetical protein